MTRIEDGMNMCSLPNSIIDIHQWSKPLTVSVQFLSTSYVDNNDLLPFLTTLLIDQLINLCIDPIKLSLYMWGWSNSDLKNHATHEFIDHNTSFSRILRPIVLDQRRYPEMGNDSCWFVSHICVYCWCGDLSNFKSSTFAIWLALVLILLQLQKEWIRR